MPSRWSDFARRLTHEVYALYLAYRDPRTPWYARVLAICIVAYAVSPLDLIPDPIPVLGYLDDLILLPIGIWFALKLIPREVMEDARRTALEAPPTSKLVSWIAGGVIVLLWIAVTIWLVLLARHYLV